MDKGEKRVDGYRFIPPSLAAWIRTFIPEDFKGPIPWKPLEKPLSAGFFCHGHQRGDEPQNRSPL